MSLGIPYMGSKRKLAPAILNAIISRHKSVTDFYDLFGGGGSISFNAISLYNFNVHYNELNSHIFELVKYLKENKTLDPKFYEWVTREEFFKQCNRTDADWYSGFVMSCWSFGNRQASYIYGSDIEEVKRLAHQFVVFGCLDSMRELNLEMPELLNIKDVQKRRNNMRAIKFRAWGGNQMHDKVCVNHDGKFIKYGYRATDWVDDANAGIGMQFTGLTDKNGKEIYEGDIIKWESSNPFSLGEIRIVSVTYTQAQFWCNGVGNMFGKFGVYLAELLTNERCEVIGNIYEHQNLLK